MNIILAMLFFNSFPGFETSVEDLRVYQPVGIPIYKIGNNYFFVGSYDNIITKTDEKGTVLASYSKEGEGPGEFNLVWTLGVMDEDLYVYSNGLVMVFDQNLNLKDNFRLYIEDQAFAVSGSFFGKSLNQSTFLLGLNYTEDILISLKKESSKWQIKRDLYIEGFHTKNHRASKSIAHNVNIREDGFFIFRNLVGEDFYQVAFYQNGIPNQPIDEEKLSALLTADITEFDIIRTSYGREYRVGISKAFNTPNGFMVQLLSYPSRGQTAYITDYFDKEGRFQKRIRNDKLIYLPVINSKEVFAYHHESGDEKITLALQ